MKGDEIPIPSNFWGYFKRELSRRVVALSFATQDTPTPREWQYASGTFVNIAGRYGILTVKHFLEPLRNELDAKHLTLLQLRFAHFSGALQTVDVLPTAIGGDFVLEIARDFDAGVIWLPEEMATERIRDDAKPFVDQELALDLSTVEVFFPILGGYPNQANIVESRSIILAKEGGQWVDYRRIRLGSVGFQCVWAGREPNSFVIHKGDLPLADDTIRLIPYGNRLTNSAESPVKSAVGMSGCPMFAIWHDESSGQTMVDPRLFGIQSKQFSIQKADYLHISVIVVVTLKALQRFLCL